jgi:hypothetical protein
LEESSDDNEDEEFKVESPSKSTVIDKVEEPSKKRGKDGKPKA